MHIKEFAERTCLTPDTIRFYEKRGLLSPARGAANGYRYYGERELEIVQQIQIGRALGFTLAEIKRGAEAWQRGKLTSALQISMIETKIDEVERKMAQLARIAAYLRKKAAWLKQGRKTVPPKWTPAPPLEQSKRGAINRSENF